MTEHSRNVIVVGNTAERIIGSEQRWRWKVFVDATANLDAAIAGVALTLHPTFRERHQTLHLADGAEISSSRYYESKTFTGWGVFVVKLDVQFQDRKELLQVEHMLCFDRGGSQQEIDVGKFLLASHVNKEKSNQMMDREQALRLLRKQPFLTSSGESLFWHGRIFANECDSLALPVISWKSNLKPRDDHDETPEWLTASEYEDSDHNTLQSKLAMLANLLRLSRKTVVYSGAGISTAAGIGMAARGQTLSRNLTTTAHPTLTHSILAELSKAGLIHGWVQQNHDGLPQKAGFPQEHINEIHGSWYDPSNPVVKYSGTLKSHECRWMEHEARTADLVLVVGTSLGGLNADQVATRCADRTLHGSALGVVLINLQQTAHDDKATLRLFGKSDAILQSLLLHHLTEIRLPPSLQPSLYQGDRRVLVPYDAKGRSSGHLRMWWDLRPGADIELTPHHNIHGSQQPRYQNMKAPYRGKVIRFDSATMGIELQICGVSFTLGQWWLDAAQRGGPRTLPIVNVHPEFAK